MKRIFFLFTALLTQLGYGQQTILFHENFDLPSGPDSVTVTVQSGVNAKLWKDTSFLYTSAGQSFHLQGSPGAVVSFETLPFSTLGDSNVTLKFNHIAKTGPMDTCRIYVSVDTGSTWIPLDANDYFGKSDSFRAQDYFNGNSYREVTDTWNGRQWKGSNSIPDNSWWVSETFDISSKVLGSSSTGFPHVIIRFEGDLGTPLPFFNQTPAGSFLAGWFIDDVQVISSACDMISPVLLNEENSICGSSGPIRYVSSVVDINGFEFVDNGILDSVIVKEYVNGVLDTTANLTLNWGSYRHTFQNYTSTDTIEWFVQAYDHCGNTTRLPASGFYKFYFRSSIDKCVDGDCNQKHQLIDTFPWKEDFEEGWVPGFGVGSRDARGYISKKNYYHFAPPFNWNHNIGWAIRQYETGSPRTGPLGDHTTGDGIYLYTEFQGFSPVAGAYMTLPCIDLRDSVNRDLSLYYHMYGSEIRKLRINIDTTPGTTNNWEFYYSVDGQQQQRPEEPWQKLKIDLSPFVGKILRVQILGSKEATNVYETDVAIDDILIQNTVARDVELIQILSPTAELCGPGAGSVKVQVFNNGNDSLQSVPMAFQLDNGTIMRDTFVTSQFTLGVTDTFTFSQAMTYNPATTHTLKVWTELSGDTEPDNDTVSQFIPVKSGRNISSFPYFLNFESATSGIPGNLNQDDWTLNSNANTATQWVIREGYQNDETGGITRAMGPDGRHLSLQRNSVSSNDFARFESGCIDLSSLSNPVLSFVYFSGSASNFLSVEIREPGKDWTTLRDVMFSMMPKQPMEGFKVSLQAYAGKSVQIAFRANNKNNDEYIALDNITIKEDTYKDLSLRYIERSQIRAGRDSIPSVQCEYTDFGQSNSGNSFFAKLRVSLQNQCDPTAPVISGVSDSMLVSSSFVNPNRSITFNNLIFSQPIPYGNYNAKYWIELVQDTFNLNDTLHEEFFGAPIFTPPYFNDFEGCNETVKLAANNIPYSNNHQWEIGEPEKTSLGTAHSGTRCAITNADSTIFQTNQHEMMRLPGFEGLDTLYDTEIRLWQNFRLGSSPTSFGIIEMFDGTKWVALNNPGVLSSNWTSLMKNVSNGSYTTGFTGSSGGWVYSTYPLHQFRNPGTQFIRFVVVKANGTIGWAIDDFEIHVPSQNSASPKALSFNNSIPKIGTNNLSVKIENTAAAPLDEVEVFLEANGNVLHSEVISITPPLDKGSARLVSLSSPVSLAASMTQLLVRTASPNNRLDQVPIDDSLLIELSFLEDIDSVPACSDFESISTYLNFDPNGSRYDSSWVYTTPQKNLIDSAHSGSKAWMTKDSAYAQLLNTYLYTPVYGVGSDSCYRFSFWQNFDTEQNFDGGLIEYSLDSGMTWYTLGTYDKGDSLWYNTEFIQSLDGVKPGFSGNSMGWIKAEKQFKIGQVDNVQFRFRFASNASISGEGWAIDDVCLEPVGKNCNYVSLAELSDFGEIQLYPNPTSGKVTLSLTNSGLEYFKLYDLAGKEFKVPFVRKSTNQLELNLSTLEDGTYIVQVSTENRLKTIRVIKN